jgi:hypothetical protein
MANAKNSIPALPASFTPTSLTAAAAAAPAGGTGATAGAYDNATNRDAMIAQVNNLRTRVLELEAALQALGFLA